MGNGHILAGSVAWIGDNSIEIRLGKKIYKSLNPGTLLKVLRLGDFVRVTYAAGLSRPLRVEQIGDT